MMIYCISKKLDVAGSHQLTLPYDSKCSRLHGAWVVRQFPQCYKAIVEESYGNVAQAFDDAFPIDARYLL